MFCIYSSNREISISGIFVYIIISQQITQIHNHLKTTTSDADAAELSQYYYYYYSKILLSQNRFAAIQKQNTQEIVLIHL
jgi:hypothetical protein